MTGQIRLAEAVMAFSRTFSGFIVRVSPSSDSGGAPKRAEITDCLVVLPVFSRSWPGSVVYRRGSNGLSGDARFYGGPPRDRPGRGGRSRAFRIRCRSPVP